MAVSGPRREKEKHAGAGLARDGMTLAGSEGRERADTAADDVVAA